MSGELHTTFWSLFNMYRTQLGYGLLSAAINALAHYKHHDSARDSFVDVLFCGALGFGIDKLMVMLNLDPDAAIIAAAMIGYIGASTISDFIKNRLGLGNGENKQ